MFAFKTLQRRLIVLLVVPVTLFLIILGVFGYRFIQGILFKEWQEIAILRLERAAHQMDMKLHEQMEWMEAFARAGYYLGIGLGMLINLLNPEKILLGGGVMTTGEFLLRPAVEEARKRSYPATFACCAIERASLGNDAGLIGAAAWGRENLSAGKTAE